MFSSTQTVTLQNPETLHLVLRSNIETESALDRLITIIEGVGERMFRKYEDPVSFELMEWGSRVLAVDLTEALEDEELFIKNVKRSLDHLRNKILVDLFAGSVLNDPLLIEETGWTCEHTFVKLSGVDSVLIKGKPITIIPHEFAKEMLAWSAPFFDAPHPNPSESPAAAPTDSSTSLVVRVSDTEFRDSIAASFLMTYKIKFTQAMSIFKLNQFMKKVSKESDMLAALMQLIDERSQEKVRQAQQEAEVHQKELEKRIDHIAEIHSEKVEILQQKATVLQDRVDDSETKVRELHSHTIQLKGEISSLQYQYYLRLQEVAALRRQAEEADDGFCIIS